MTAELNLWQQQNDTYLNAALAWLRLRMMKLASNRYPISNPDPAPEPSPASMPKSQWKFFRNAEATPPPILILPPPEDTLGDQLEQAAKGMREAAEMIPPPALLILSRQFGLSEYEQNILLLCAAVEYDTRIAYHCEQVQGDRPSRPYPTFALAMTLFDEPAWDAMSPDRPLRYWRLLEINQPGAQPLTTSALKADERIVNFMKGLNGLDDRLTLLVDPVPLEKEPLPPSQQAVVEHILQHVQQSAAEGSAAVMQLSGPGTSSKEIIAREVAEQLRLGLYRLSADNIPLATGELETFVRLWKRETLLLPVRLYLVATDEEGSGGPEMSAARIAAVKRLITRHPDLMFVESREPLSELEEVTTLFEVEKPTPPEQRTLWAEELGPEGEETAALLAGQFYLEARTIHRLAQISRVESGEKLETADRIWARCCLHTRPNFDALAKRVDVKATWDDLILPADATALLRQVADQVRHRTLVYDEWGYRDRMNRGFGISALFAGESGTGKTMAAEVVAHHLQLPLYQVDLSTITSKYIGETEKNLRRCFDTCEESGAILCFNEADTLFSKRVEQTSHLDQFANNIINYLLQRMEAYRGLAILTTNIKNAVDQAFLRRLRFIVHFPFPGVAERKRMWERAFPKQMPRDPLDYDRLARFSLTGGNVHNAALNAAFLAAQAGTPVRMPVVLAAIRNEFKKLERPMNEAEFRWLEPAVGGG